MGLLGLNRKIKTSSLIGTEGKADDLLINILKKIKADTYLAGPGGKNYMNLEKYKKNNIKVIFHEFEHPEYKQRFDKFVPNLSIVDFLFNSCYKKV